MSQVLIVRERRKHLPVRKSLPQAADGDVRWGFANPKIARDLTLKLKNLFTCEASSQGFDKAVSGSCFNRASILCQSFCNFGMAVASCLSCNEVSGFIFGM